MKTILAFIVTTVLIVAITLAAMFLLVWATVYVTSLPTPLHRAAGMGAELVLGIVLLLGTVWLATHLAVRIFGTKEAPPLPQAEELSKAASTAPSSGGSVV
jgi:hypothetical protein